MKNSSNRRNKSQGVSLPPRVRRDATKRAGELDISFSKYIQRLIKYDLTRKALGDAVS